MKFRYGLCSRLSSGKLVLQPADFPTPFFWRGKHNFPLPTLVLWTRCLPFSGSALRPRGTYPPWNSRLICFTNPSKSAYSSARSPLRGTMPARLRMTSEPPSLPESLDEAEYHLHYRTNINLARFRCGRGDIKDLAFGCRKSILDYSQVNRLWQIRPNTRHSCRSKYTSPLFPLK